MRAAPISTGILAYTPGTQEVRFPAGTGLPVGTGQGELQHIILNVHYNNPTLVRGLRDRSGFRFVYSRDTVAETVSMLKLGDPAALDYLPLPRAEATLECPAGCTFTFPHAVRVFAAMPHMHLRGRALQMFIRRQNAADEELVFNVEFYDHEFQSYVPVDFLIEPGDTVITRCTYDTSDADRDVTMGQATSQEMCLGAVLYYPKINGMALCGPAGHQSTSGISRTTGIEDYMFCGSSQRTLLPQGQPGLQTHRDESAFRRTFGVAGADEGGSGSSCGG